MAISSDAPGRVKAHAFSLEDACPTGPLECTDVIKTSITGILAEALCDIPVQLERCI